MYKCMYVCILYVYIYYVYIYYVYIYIYIYIYTEYIFERNSAVTGSNPTQPNFL